MLLGVTDYCSLRGYKNLRARWLRGELLKVKYIFPNIEFRLNLQTHKGGGVNIHIFVCPDQDDHIERIEEKLRVLKFTYEGEQYSCSDSELIRLGRAHKKDKDYPEDAAISAGANQFKVEFGSLQNLRSDEWIQRNVLFALPGAKDGLAGLSRDASFHAHREELGRFADLILSGSPSDRKFWLGEHQDFGLRNYIRKPCLHGCDAHRLEQVLRPERDRLCWVRASPSFEGLRQTLAEPERRVYIGPMAPTRVSSSETLAAVRVRNASWFPGDRLSLNEGLVTIIGPKGSGKTALADFIAFASNALDPDLGPASFIRKAGGLLRGTTVELEWGDGRQVSATFGAKEDVKPEPQVRYLSQQFVERLCSPEEGLAEPLVEEIEAVVFNALPEEDRLQEVSFGDLRAASIDGLQREQARLREIIAKATKEVNTEWELWNQQNKLQQKLRSAKRHCGRLEKEIESIPTKGKGDRRREFDEVRQRLQSLQNQVANSRRQQQRLSDLAKEVGAYQVEMDKVFRDWRDRFRELRISEDEWKALRPQFDDDSFSVLNRRKEELRRDVEELVSKGVMPGEKADSAGVESNGLNALKAAHQRLLKELGLDEANEKRRAELEKRLVEARKQREQLRSDVEYAGKAKERIQSAQRERLDSYLQLFEAIEEETKVLERLYRPLRQRLDEEPSLGKLSFFVHRKVDAGGWANRGEDLLDLRRREPFKGRGTLLEVAEEILVPVWRSGNPAEAREAMEKFLTDYGQKAVKNLAHDITPQDFGEWVFSTSHISVEYGLQYEGVDLARLSPGTRGVVLLTLYLGLDEWDTRPLLIDQPEENLDPKSVFEDLVGFFREAARRRQVIMVTHNANLVVNTDADQVIVASSTRHGPAELPHMEYISGALEDTDIHAEVCSVLEGGKDAFRRRGVRYGLLR